MLIVGTELLVVRNSECRLLKTNEYLRNGHNNYFYIDVT